MFAAIRDLARHRADRAKTEHQTAVWRDSSAMIFD
jgi:hypothetical protein